MKIMNKMKKTKKIKKITKISLILFITLFMVTGCKEEVRFSSGEKVTADTDTTNATGILICSRNGKGLNNSTAELSYEVSYKKGYLEIVHSLETLISEDQETLDTYENAYKNIFNTYKDLEHYENSIKRETDRVTSDTTINYSKIDMNKLEALEASDQNLIKNGKISLKDWLTFAEKLGTKCIEK